MAWDYEYLINGVDPMQWCTAFDVITEGMAGREGINFRVPGLHGEKSYPFKLFEGHNIVINSILRYTDDDDLITHVNGSAGHVYENKNALMGIFGLTDSLVTIQRENPDGGTEEIFIEILDSIENTRGLEHQYLWTARAPKPFWQEVAATAVPGIASGTFGPGGTAPVDDMVWTFHGDGVVANNTTGDRIEIAGSGGADVVVDCGNRTIREGSADRDEWFIYFTNRWTHFKAGANSLSVSGSVDLSYHVKRH